MHITFSNNFVRKISCYLRYFQKNISKTFSNKVLFAIQIPISELHVKFGATLLPEKVFREKRHHCKINTIRRRARNLYEKQKFYRAKFRLNPSKNYVESTPRVLIFFYLIQITIRNPSYFPSRFSTVILKTLFTARLANTKFHTSVNHSPPLSPPRHRVILAPPFRFVARKNNAKHGRVIDFVTFVSTIWHSQ